MCSFAKLFPWLACLPVLFIGLMLIIPRRYIKDKIWVRFWIIFTPFWLLTFTGMVIGGMIASDFKSRPSMTDVCHKAELDGLGSPIIIGGVIGAVLALILVLVLRKRVRDKGK